MRHHQVYDIDYALCMYEFKAGRAYGIFQLTKVS
jgi:hypothetical protein